MLPVEFGGEGASLGDIAEICAVLGQHCASAAMVFAMHQIQVSSLVSHARSSAWHQGFLRAVAEHQYLLASATSEAGVGGDVRTSLCAVETTGDLFHLDKNASVISYGSQADAILATARRAPDVAALRPGARRRPARPVQPGADVGLGHARHARDLLGRLQAQGERAGGAGPAAAFRGDLLAIHARHLAPALGEPLVRDRAQRRAPSAGFRARRCAPPSRRRAGRRHPRRRGGRRPPADEEHDARRA